jgi:protein SCO1/2
MSLRPSLSSIAAIAVAISSLTFALIISRTNAEAPLILGTIPEFELIERSGSTMTRADLDGQVWVADFIFTNCGGTCPMMTYQMAKLNKALPESVRLVSFTVDPTRDTPATLSEYAIRNDVEGDRWFFLTGEREDLYRLAQEGFHLAVDDTIGTEVEPITHSSRFALIDEDGNIRNYYDGTSLESIDQIIGDVETLLAN